MLTNLGLARAVSSQLTRLTDKARQYHFRYVLLLSACPPRPLAPGLSLTILILQVLLENSVHHCSAYDQAKFSKALIFSSVGRSPYFSFGISRENCLPSETKLETGHRLSY